MARTRQVSVALDTANTQHTLVILKGVKVGCLFLNTDIAVYETEQTWWLVKCVSVENDIL